SSIGQNSLGSMSGALAISFCGTIAARCIGATPLTQIAGGLCIVPRSKATRGRSDAQIRHLQHGPANHLFEGAPLHRSHLMIAVESSNRQQICQRLRDPFAKKLWSCRNPAVVTATDRMEIAQFLSVTPEPKCDTRFSLLSCALHSLIRPLPSNSSRPPFRSASSEQRTSRSLARLTSLAVSRRSVGLKLARGLPVFWTRCSSKKAT